MIYKNLKFNNLNMIFTFTFLDNSSDYLKFVIDFSHDVSKIK